MYKLDPVGRLAPSSLDVSRAAARRHAHLAPLGADPGSSKSALRGRLTRARWPRVVANRAQALTRATRSAHPTEVQW